MMSRLEARERIARSHDVALGSGTLTDEAKRNLVDELSTRARGPSRAKRASRRDIAGMGIGMRVSPAKADTPEGDGNG